MGPRCPSSSSAPVTPSTSSSPLTRVTRTSASSSAMRVSRSRWHQEADVHTDWTGGRSPDHSTTGPALATLEHHSQPSSQVTGTQLLVTFRPGPLCTPHSFLCLRMIDCCLTLHCGIKCLTGHEHEVIWHPLHSCILSSSPFVSPRFRGLTSCQYLRRCHGCDLRAS